ncbi:DUF3180 domain-containing protein [Glutamicibacter protophormiae]|jgi:hypothetical protein|uniref:DUF3180 domain-containing protein n=1 Tax=Glutamicibacter protophormiae TaxID=37930 RepID=A0ABS4XNI0_GLUPR|nr:DUF3180 domain-containing protein [Glutamicibacter protophormiae]MBP2398048.1 hypothetical protein [Glutamicibacter protophormiae]GGM02358.1 hypothetical protein GCM10010038_35530 [Glutamicibacter protophormiae]
MTRLKVLSLVWCTLLGAVLGWIALRLFVAAGRPTPVLDYTALYSLGAVCAVVLFLGIRVKRSTLGKAHFDAIAAARTLVLAQAAAYAGALITGWHLPALVNLWVNAGASPSLTRAIVLAGAGLFMVVIGYIVQHLCKLPPEDPEDTADGIADGTVTE